MMEMDSDAHHDPGREELLDRSFEDWMAQVGEQVNRKLDMTDVPGENVFDAAAVLDEENAGREKE